MSNLVTHVFLGVGPCALAAVFFASAFASGPNAIIGGGLGGALFYVSMLTLAHQTVQAMRRSGR